MPDGPLRAWTQAALAAAPGLELHHARTLREAYNLTEEVEPRAALVAGAMAALPEFNALRMLFDAIGLRWMTVSDPVGAGQGPGLRPTPAGDPFLDRISALLRSGSTTGAPGPRSTERSVAGRPGAAPQGSVGRTVLIGASTGGIEALLTILRNFPAACPPTVITQHTGLGYGASLADLLDRNCAARVVPASESLQIGPGQIVLAGGTGRHFELEPDGRRGRLTGSQPVCGHCPSVDVMFRSALPIAQRAVGVLLTGMGDDGAAALLELRRAGARTLGQDEASSVVYGMPRAAARIGALTRQAALEALGPAILSDAAAPVDGRQAS